MPTLILDNGAGTIKGGFVEQEEPLIFPNVTAKVKKSLQFLVSDQVYQYQNTAMLDFTRPFERGYLTNFQSEIEILTHLFKTSLKCNPTDTSLVLSEPVLNPYTVQSDMNEIIFEYFGFKEYLRRPAPWFSANKCMNYQHLDVENLPACVIIDSGFSFTHIIPFLHGKCQRQAIKRINVGGKLLTNYLKELVSYRQWNMMDEFVLINQVKEQLCYVSNDVLQELSAAKGRSRFYNANNMKDPFGGRLKKNFVLPDFHHIMKGYVKNDDDVITKEEQVKILSYELKFIFDSFFSDSYHGNRVPELLFYPSDIGLNQAGIAEATWMSLNCITQPRDIFMATSKIVLTGGNTKFPNFLNRYRESVRPFIPDMYRINVFQSEQPDLFAWYAMRDFVLNTPQDTYYDHFLRRSDYLEYGQEYSNRFFDKGW